MSTSLRIFFVFALLMLSQEIFGIDRYFMWVDPQTKLRARINPETLELYKERESGPWLREGKVKLDPQIFNNLPEHFNNTFFILGNGRKILLQVIGTGQLFEYDSLEKEFKRLDKTFHSGYNFTANQFIRNGILYSIGGEGFWNYNTSITYFAEQVKEWEILRPKNKGPLAITDGFQGYSSKQDVYYSGGSKHKNFLEVQETNYIDDFYLFDFKKNEWQFLGKLNSNLLPEKSEGIIWTGEVFFHFLNKAIYIIDPNKNEVYLHQNSRKDLGIGLYRHVYQDTLIIFKGINEGPVQKISISEIRKNTTYVGKFYSTGIAWQWYAVGLFLIIFIMTILKWKRKETIDSKELMFTQLERKFLNKLLGLKPNEYLNTYEINDILEASDKTQENQRKIRFNVISQINKKLKAKYNWDNAIDRKPLPEDKRLTIYKLDPVVMNELKRIMR